MEISYNFNHKTVFMALKEEKLQVIRELIRMNNMDLFKDVKKLIHSYKQEEEIPHEYADREDITFNQWLRQYTDDKQNPEVYLPEYNMTLREFWEYTFHQERRSNNLE